jgi:CMP/dCMP kinase
MRILTANRIWRIYSMKSELITLAGTLGSGKSSAAKRLAAELGYKHFSSGDLFRAMAAERGLTVEEINQRAELEHEIDHAVDERLREMSREQHLIVDSRMAFHWMPNSFKVFLNLDLHVAAERIYKHIQVEGRASQSGETVEAIHQNTVFRKESEIKRYQSLYGVDIYDLSHYDLVVDTEKNNLDQVVEIILREYRAWLSN